MKEKYIISVHSMIDIITNSSTEIFIFDADKELEIVRELVYEKEKEFPNEYNHKLSVDYCEDWHLQRMTGYYWDDDEQEMAIKQLESKGYKVIKPSGDEAIKPKYMEITFERGGMHPELNNFIRNTFNVVYHDTEA
jgi:hypothetical protein